jgi:uncharacterized membrane protein YcaP (DUF421 family)
MNHNNNGETMELINVTFRTILFYFLITLAYRIMGKREVGQLGVTDLIVSILIAELVAISIENFNDTILYTVIPIITLVFLEIFLAFISLKSKKIRNFFDGKPSLIIAHGKVNYKEMVNLRYSIDDLLLQLRQNSIKSLEDVEFAFLEPNGKLSIFPFKAFHLKSNYPMPLIVDGIIQNATLVEIKKDKNWVLKMLNKKHLTPQDIFYAFYKKGSIYLIKYLDTISN